ncbi:neutral alpha-glucosidase AB-like isoform X2 [Octopus vulgaris]|uniref:Neutral alpha-glucosidase AB n=1 Tax=Octopus vulgaris TaxID=6645 RepID=A0AA36F4M4_OCTVU|nr:neutral alpha-glucosidase AB-like isoform X2 [Octopus vulgaris]
MALSCTCLIRSTMAQHWHVVLYCICLIYSVVAVSRENFKTCEQSGFCKRQRAVEAGHSSYAVLLDSLDLKPSSITLQLVNRKNNVRFKLELYALAHNMARIKLNEFSPLKSRYEIPIGDTLIKEPVLQNLKLVSKEKNSLILSFETNHVVITAEPFRIDFLTNDHPVLSINSQGLFKFEHLRQKQDANPAEPPQEGGESNEEKKENTQEESKSEPEEPDMWEETFKSFTDSKPNGPTSVGIDISFPGFENVYGIPEHADSFALKSTKSTDPYRLYNLDVFEYELYNPMALYGSIPVMLAHNEERTVGVFWHNAAETWVDITSNVADKNLFKKMMDYVKGDQEIPQTDTHWFSESGIIDVFVMLGPKPKDVFYQYSLLTGTTPLPPLFALAYHQSRWNYNDEEDVKNVDNNFDVHDIPYDVLWLDIEHTDGKRYFTWDNAKFPNPEDMVRNLSSKGRKLVNVVDPHLKRDDDYSIYKEGKEKDIFVKNKDGGVFEGWCWPGSSSWPDFLDPNVREWWASKFDFKEYKGTTKDVFIWNDMNEPSVFNGPEITMPKDLIHVNGWEHRDIHNIYGMHVHRATMEGILARSNHQERSFVLTRAIFAGSQRYAAVWTGDNTGEWGHLKMSVPMMLSLNVAGMPFSGADVGGFFRNPDPELLTRWYQAAAFQPFFRAHAHLDTKRREPWLLPEMNKNIIRNAIHTRYTFLPYWYTLFRHSEKSGMPVMIPLWVEFPEESSIFKTDDEYLLGPALLVKPVVDPGVTSTGVHFPGKGEIWYDIMNFKSFAGGQSVQVDAPLDKIPVYIRGGFIIPRKYRMRRSSILMRHDPFSLIVCLDRNDVAKGDLYIDDYHSTKYKQAEFAHQEFTFEKNTLSTKLVNPQTSYKTKEWIERIIIAGLEKQPMKPTLSVNGSPSKILETKYYTETKVLVIRKPGVNIMDNWTITLE